MVLVSNMIVETGNEWGVRTQRQVADGIKGPSGPSEV